MLVFVNWSFWNNELVVDWLIIYWGVYRRDVVNDIVDIFVMVFVVSVYLVKSFEVRYCFLSENIDGERKMRSEFVG